MREGGRERANGQRKGERKIERQTYRYEHRGNKNPHLIAVSICRYALERKSVR